MIIEVVALDIAFLPLVEKYHENGGDKKSSRVESLAG